MMGPIIVVESFEQIGAKLRSAREAAGLDVEDVAFRTRIPRSVVESLEAEDFSVFISPVYAKSFLSQYSEFLNVDAQIWLDALEPGSFMAGGQVHALLDGPETLMAEKAPATEPRGGLLSVLGLLTLSSAIVVGAIKGYEYFEISFGAAERPKRPAPVLPAPKIPAAAAVPVEAAEMKPVAELEDEESANPPPRAIIVR
jgi:cytoskeleton protein RodZ